MMNKALWRSWLVCLVVTAVATPLCIEYVDRPVALFFAQRFLDTPARDALVWLVLPFGPLVLVAYLVLIGSGLSALSGHKMPRLSRRLSIPLVTVGLAMGCELMLKVIFARSEILPTFLYVKQYGFDFLHYRDGWRSFPSGTAIGLFALSGILLVHRSRWRLFALFVAGVVSIVIVIVSYHWVSDVIAGAFVGLTIGYATGSILDPPASGAADLAVQPIPNRARSS